MTVGSSSAYSAALSGMRAAQQTLLNAASGGDDLTSMAVDLIKAPIDFAANVKVVQAQDEMDRSLLNILA